MNPCNLHEFGSPLEFVRFKFMIISSIDRCSPIHLCYITLMYLFNRIDHYNGDGWIFDWIRLAFDDGNSIQCDLGGNTLIDNRVHFVVPCVDPQKESTGRPIGY